MSSRLHNPLYQIMWYENNIGILTGYEPRLCSASWIPFPTLFDSNPWPQSVVVAFPTMVARDVILSKLGPLAHSLLHDIGIVCDSPSPRKCQVLSSETLWTYTVLLSPTSSYVVPYMPCHNQTPVNSLLQISIVESDFLQSWTLFSHVALVVGHRSGECQCTTKKRVAASRERYWANPFLRPHQYK